MRRSSIVPKNARLIAARDSNYVPGIGPILIVESVRGIAAHLVRKWELIKAVLK